MAYIATFLGIWLVIASILAIPVGKILAKLAKNDREFAPEHQIWKQGADARRAAVLLADAPEMPASPDLEQRQITASQITL
jgi:hypothetical protein